MMSHRNENKAQTVNTLDDLAGPCPVEMPDTRFMSETALQAFFVHAPLPVILLDEDGGVLLANRAFAPPGQKPQGRQAIGAALGCVRAIADKNAPDLCGHTEGCRECDLRQLVRDTLDNARHHWREPAALRIGEDKATRLHLLVSSVPVWVAGEPRVLVYLEDVSELERMRAITEQFNRELEKKVDARTSEVRQLLEQKEAFVNQLGHDLRTPLTPLVALLPLLKQRLSDPKVLEMIEVIQNNADYMWDLVSKTLDLIRADCPQSRLNFQAVNLKDQVNQAVKDISPLIEKKQIDVRLNVPESLHVRADPLEFREVLANLLGNAVKFMSTGGQLTVTGRRDGHEVQVAVKDTGIGMLTRQLAHVFEEFYKADESRHDRRSPGLGLSICKRIIENHNGHIWAESEGLGKGSTFLFTLPAWSEPHALGGNGPDEIHRNSSPTLVPVREVEP